MVILFLFSLLTLNFFTFLQKEKNQRKILAFLQNRCSLCLLPILIFLSEFLYTALTDLPHFGGWNVFSLLLYYIYGFVLVSDAQLMEKIEKNVKEIIIITSFSFIGLLVVTSFFYEDIFLPTPNVYLLSEPLFWLFRCIFAWSGLLLILLIGYKYLNEESRPRKFLNELVLPFYILHQTILLLFGFFIIQLNEGILLKYFLVIIPSFICIFILLLIIREENTLRFLFGMRLKQGKSILRLVKRNKRAS